MAYSEINKESPDLMKLKLGNLLPQTEAIIIVSYVEELEVCMNKFWRLSLVTTTRPRYKPNYKPFDEEDFNNLIQQIGPNNPNVRNRLFHSILGL